MGKRKQKIKINDKKKIKKISELNKVEDLFIISHELTEKEMDSLILEYKKKLDSLNNLEKEALPKIIKKSNNSKELKEKIVLSLSEELEREYEELKDLISEKRKKGFDSFIVDLKISPVPLKIKLFKSTKDKRDYLNVKKILIEVKKLILQAY